MPGPISSTAIAIGSWFAQQIAAKGFEAVWKRFKRGRILDRAIEKTSQRFTPSEKSVSGGMIRNCLEQWTDHPGFERLFRSLAEGEEIDKDRIVNHYRQKGDYPESTTRQSADAIVEFFLQQLMDELYNSDEGRALMMRRLEEMEASRQADHDSLQEGVNTLEEGLKRIEESTESLSRPAREAVNSYLEESQTWYSPEKLAEQDRVREAIEVLEGGLEKIRELQEHHPEVGPLFHEHKQYLLLKSAVLYSQLGEETEADKNYELAKADGVSSPKHRQLALTVLMNLQRAEEYRKVMEGGEVDDEEEAEINLLLLEDRWEELAEALPDEPQKFRHAYLRVVAELSRDQLTLSPAELNHHLDRAESLAEDRRVQKAQLAMMTVDLLLRVVNEMLETPELNRSELVDSARSRTERALSEYDNGEADVGLYSLLQKAQQLYHLLSDDQRQEEIEDRYKQVTDGLNSRDEWDRALSKGQITQAHHLFLQAGDLLDNPAGSQEEEAVSLLESAFLLAEEQDLRLAIAERLINLHLKRKQTSKAESILDRLDGVPEYRLVLLRLPVMREKNGVQEAINYLAEKADSYPRHLYMRRVLIRYMTSRIEEVVNDPLVRDEVHSLDDRIRERGKELQRILPTDQHTVMVAQGLFAARHYNGVVNLLDEVVEADDPPVEAMRIRGEALRQLQRLDEAANQIAAIAKSTADPMYAVNAAGYWLEEDKAEQAISFLEPWLEAHHDDPLLKFNLATALIRSRSENPESGRRAFNLLAKACTSDRIPATHIRLRMSRAASIAGKADIAQRYRERAFPNPPTTVQTEEDLEDLWQEAENELVPFRPAGREGLEAFVERQKEHVQKLNELYSAELLSYGDLFRQNGRMFEYWTQWTETAWEHHKSNPEMTAIKAPWPTVTRQREEKEGLLLDITALLTIWRLGRAEAFLRTLQEEGINPHIRADDLEMLRQAVVPYLDYMFDTVDRSYRQLADTLRSYDLLPEFQPEEVEHFEQLVPDDLQESLMASTPDFGLACDLDDAVFVTDRQDGLGYDAVLEVPRVMSSAGLLRALVDYGSLGMGEAESAAEQYERFRGWEEQTDQDVPHQVVLSGFALVDWFESGLLTAFDNAWLQGEPGWPGIHLGPYAVNHILEQDQEQRTKEQKTENVSTLYAELKELIEQDVVTVLPVEDSSPRDEEGLRLPEMAPYPSKLIQIADENGLDVWSDDRVIGYLLWSFGHPLPVPEVKQEFMQFRERYSGVNLTTTEELVETMSRNGALESEEAEELGYELVKLGYRPLNFRLALAYLFRNYAYQTGSPRYEPLFRVIKSVIVDPESEGVGGDEIPALDSESLQRLMFASVLPDLIASVWRAPVSRSVEDRRTLATDLIDLVVDRLKDLGQNLENGMTSFWVGLLQQIAAPPVDHYSDGKSPEEVNNEHLDDAVEWFTEILIEREDADRQRRVVRGIEDRLIDELPTRISMIPDSVVIEEDEERPNDEEIRGRKASAAVSLMQPYIIALFESDLLEEVDPLFRRALGVLSRSEGEYKAHSTYTVEGTAIEVGEDEKERFALQIVSDSIEGDPQANQVIRGDWSVEATWDRPIPEEVQNENPELPETHDVPLKISLATLLLRDDVRMLPGFIDTTILHLQLLDPSLAQNIQAAREDLLSEDEQVRQHGREATALDLLRSPFFELQRDLRHAISRLRGIDTNRLEKFLSPERGWHAGEKNPRIETGEDREYPRSMLTDFRMLYAEPAVIYESAEKEVEAILGELEGDDDESIDLREVVKGMVHKTKDQTSPLGMARSLLTLLVFTESTDESISFDSDDREWLLRGWIGEFVCAILDRGNKQTAEEIAPVRSQHYKEIHAIALRLGANVVGNEEHLQKWNEDLDDERDVLVQWIWSTMLFTSRVIPFLVGRFGATPELRDVLDGLARDLSIAYEEPIVTPDRFDPFLLGPHFLDHEVAAVLHVLSIFVERCESPGDVLDLGEVQLLAERWTKVSGGQAEEVYEAQKEGAREVVDLQMPLSPRSAASRLVELISSGAG